jgi:hypothetical protein
MVMARIQDTGYSGEDVCVLAEPRPYTLLLPPPPGPAPVISHQRARAGGVPLSFRTPTRTHSAPGRQMMRRLQRKKGGKGAPSQTHANASTLPSDDRTEGVGTGWLGLLQSAAKSESGEMVCASAEVEPEPEPEPEPRREAAVGIAGLSAAACAAAPSALRAQQGAADAMELLLRAVLSEGGAGTGGAGTGGAGGQQLAAAAEWLLHLASEEEVLALLPPLLRALTALPPPPPPPPMTTTTAAAAAAAPDPDPDRAAVSLAVEEPLPPPPLLLHEALVRRAVASGRVGQRLFWALAALPPDPEPSSSPPPPPAVAEEAAAAVPTPAMVDNPMAGDGTSIPEGTPPPPPPPPPSKPVRALLLRQLLSGMAEGARQELELQLRLVRSLRPPGPPTPPCAQPPRLVRFCQLRGQGTVLPCSTTRPLLHRRMIGGICT